MKRFSRARQFFPVFLLSFLCLTLLASTALPKFVTAQERPSSSPYKVFEMTEELSDKKAENIVRKLYKDELQENDEITGIKTNIWARYTPLSESGNEKEFIVARLEGSFFCYAPGCEYIILQNTGGNKWREVFRRAIVELRTARGSMSASDTSSLVAKDLRWGLSMWRWSGETFVRVY